jgi:hypothetical protein
MISATASRGRDSPSTLAQPVEVDVQHHHNEQEQHHHRADVDQNQRDGQELRFQQHPQPRRGSKGEYQG